jgi:hypothetical protein
MTRGRISKVNGDEVVAGFTCRDLARRQAPLNKINPWSNPMLQDIVEAIPMADFVLKLRFEDGTIGTVDVSRCVSFTGVFA